MSRPNRPARLNRALLGALGLLLLAAGAAVLLASSGLLAPRFDPAAPLVAPGTGVQPWVPYASIVASVVLGLLCVRWLLARAFRAPRTRIWRLMADTPAQGVAYLAADTAADAIAADIQAYPGVARATASLTGHRSAPTLHLNVSTTTGSPIEPLRAQIADHALPRLRHALELDALPANLLLRLDTTSTPSRTR
ncbi:MAG TPA: alkaline shock response membrane anchor protein AmaP [Pseudonocardia sp.]|jgi:hypothetical protein|nr:alkaline shock response membrane anchor protein AmaP [Pseudonocardia sp.]